MLKYKILNDYDPAINKRISVNSFLGSEPILAKTIAIPFSSD